MAKKWPDIDFEFSAEAEKYGDTTSIRANLTKGLFEFYSFSNLCNNYGIPTPKNVFYGGEVIEGQMVIKKDYEFTFVNQENPGIVIDGSLFVLTGFEDASSKTFNRVADLINNNNGIWRTAVSGKTDYVIRYSGYRGGITFKVKEAYRQMKKGKNVKVIDERRFFYLCQNILPPQQ